MAKVKDNSMSQGVDSDLMTLILTVWKNLIGRCYVKRKKMPQT